MLDSNGYITIKQPHLEQIFAIREITQINYFPIGQERNIPELYIFTTAHPSGYSFLGEFATYLYKGITEFLDSNPDSNLASFGSSGV